MRKRMPKLLPCPFCGHQPEVDFGFSDAPYPDGEEFIGCVTVRSFPGGHFQGCGTSQIGARAWNARAP